VVLINHLFAQDVIKACAQHRISCLAGVPPLWLQLAALEWPAAAAASLRLITNSGGHLPRHCLQTLRQKLPHAQPYLMYGLTEAFRSTYLPPEEIDRRIDSMGRAIPNAEILVLNHEGKPCAAGEVGELVHRGVHVALGYWNDAEKTAARYKPLPRRPQQSGLVFDELAVWSGDLVKKDADGYLYYVGRNDEQIKVSGYRVSPGEVEEVLYTVPGVVEAIATGSKHPKLGEAIVVIAYVDSSYVAKTMEKQCAHKLPAWMQPALLELRHEALPRNPNGKIDRSGLKQQFAQAFLTSDQ
jgi:acyl-CoA synthetase (AMP-forming)/AMP-acid ligase II